MHAKPLRTILRHVLERIASAAIDDAVARYDLGGVVLTIRMAAGRYRGARIEDVAAAMHRDISEIRRCARVAGNVSPKEFAWMMSLRSRRGLPLTWSHVELLSRVPSESERRELAREVISRDLSVRSLASRVRRHQRGSR